MKKEILITIRGLQFEGEHDSEEIETILPGEYYKKNDWNYVLYEEGIEGTREVIKNIIKFKEKEFSITKRGAVNVHMIFEEKKKCMTNYLTPFGSIMVGLDAQKVHMQEEEEAILVNIDYGLEVNYEYMTDCTIHVEIRPRTAAEKLM